MQALNIFIPPISEKTQARVEVAYTVRGLAWYLTRRTGSPHPLDIAHLLGLTTQCGTNWWRLPANQPLMQEQHTGVIFRLLSEHYHRSLAHFDMHLIVSRFRRFPATQHAEILASLQSQLTAISLPTTPLTSQQIWQERAQIMQLSDKIPADVMSKLSMNLASLEQALLAKDPLMSQHLRSSHQLLISYPETVHLLDDSEVATLIAAAEQHTKTQIIKDTVKKGAGTSKKLSVTDL